MGGVVAERPGGVSKLVAEGIKKLYLNKIYLFFFILYNKWEEVIENKIAEELRERPDAVVVERAGGVSKLVAEDIKFNLFLF